MPKKKRKPPYAKRLRTAKKRVWTKLSQLVRREESDPHTGRVKCVSCDSMGDWKDYHAGHFIAAGKSSVLRYLRKNIHVQCAGCNTFKGGNLLQYRRWMVGVYGEDEVKKLEDIGFSHQTKKWNLGELEELEQEIDDQLSSLNSLSQR